MKKKKTLLNMIRMMMMMMMKTKGSIKDTKGVQPILVIGKVEVNVKVQVKVKVKVVVVAVKVMAAVEVVAVVSIKNIKIYIEQNVDDIDIDDITHLSTYNARHELNAMMRQAFLVNYDFIPSDNKFLQNDGMRVVDQIDKIIGQLNKQAEQIKLYKKVFIYRKFTS